MTTTTATASKFQVLVWAEGREGQLGGSSIFTTTVPADTNPAEAIQNRWERASAYRIDPDRSKGETVGPWIGLK
jgi:hypothetical protein